MRTVVITVTTFAVFTGLCFGASLQDRMRRKGGPNSLSPMFIWRALLTREAFLFICLICGLFLFAISMGQLDKLGYLGR